MFNYDKKAVRNLTIKECHEIHKRLSVKGGGMQRFIEDRIQYGTDQSVICLVSTDSGRLIGWALLALTEQSIDLWAYTAVKYRRRHIAEKASRLLLESPPLKRKILSEGTISVYARPMEKIIKRVLKTEVKDCSVIIDKHW